MSFAHFRQRLCWHGRITTGFVKISRQIGQISCFSKMSMVKKKDLLSTVTLWLITQCMVAWFPHCVLLTPHTLSPWAVFRNHHVSCHVYFTIYAGQEKLDCWAKPLELERQDIEVMQNVAMHSQSCRFVYKCVRIASGIDSFIRD